MEITSSLAPLDSNLASLGLYLQAAPQVLLTLGGSPLPTQPLNRTDKDLTYVEPHTLSSRPLASCSHHALLSLSVLALSSLVL